MIVVVILGVLLVSTVVAAIILSSSTVKGKLGERKTAAKLKGLKRKHPESVILRNMYIPKADGGTSEIDILFIDDKGIYVIENKNYMGYIFGDDKRPQWTVSLYAGKDVFGDTHTRKIQFYNPIWQNNTHIRNLKNYLEMDVPCHSVIAFSDRCDLMDITYPADVHICYQSNIKKVISLIDEGLPVCLTADVISRLVNKLEPLTNRTKEEKEKHIDRIYEKTSDPLKCPLCGGKLVLRTAKKGPDLGHQFVGCSNYPRCKYTRSF